MPSPPIASTASAPAMSSGRSLAGDDLASPGATISSLNHDHMGPRTRSSYGRGDESPMIELHEQLARMEAARNETRRHVDVIERQIAGRAERLTVTERAKSRLNRR